MANESGVIRISNINSRKPIISGLGATLTLTEDQSGSTVLFDRAAGSVVTLPAASANGTNFEFVVSVTNTTPSDKVITGAAAELLVGNIVNCDTDSGNATLSFPALVGSSFIAVILNGGTTGGIKGDRLLFTKVNSTTWSATGTTNGTGTVATPFSVT